MATFSTASHLELQQLMDLFPVANLKQGWPKLNVEKAKLCQEIASERNCDAIAAFIDEHIGSCKQHVYIFEASEDTEIPNELPSCETIYSGGDNHTIFLAVKEIGVIITTNDRMERRTLRFLWPVKLQRFPNHLVVRFITLQKNVGSHLPASEAGIPSSYVKETDTPSEEDILAGVGLKRCDIHKGIKKIWDDKIIDCPRLKYKDPDATNDRLMDEARGIRRTNPDLYSKVKTLEIINAAFLLEQTPTKTPLRGFQVEPSKGQIVISSYSETKGDSDFVLSEILRLNQ